MEDRDDIYDRTRLSVMDVDQFEYFEERAIPKDVYPVI